MYLHIKSLLWLQIGFYPYMDKNIGIWQECESCSVKLQEKDVDTFYADKDFSISGIELARQKQTKQANDTIFSLP